MGLTIVTVVKNDASGLERTLRSIDRQDAAARLLVMDGGSSDTTIDVIETWARPLSIEVESQQDSGPYDAMNKAIAKLADDDLVWFVNAGDTLLGDDAISTALKVTSRTNFAWGFGPHQIVETSGKPRRIVRGRPFSVNNFAYGQTPICHQAVISRISCLREVGCFNLAYPIAADYRSLIQLGLRWAPMQWDEVLVQYQAGGISDRNLQRTIREQSEARRAILSPVGSHLVADHVYDLRRKVRYLARQSLMRIGFVD